MMKDEKRTYKIVSDGTGTKIYDPDGKELKYISRCHISISPESIFAVISFPFVELEVEVPEEDVDKKEERAIRDESGKVIAATTEESLKEDLPEVDLEKMAKKIAERLSIKLKDWWSIMPRDKVEKTILMILNTETEILKEMGIAEEK